MDLNKGFPLKQQQNFEIQHLWIPTTPAKTTTASRQMNQPPGPTRLEPAVLVANATQDTAPPWGFGTSTSSGIPDHLQDVKVNRASALAASGHATTMFQAPAASNVNVNSLECWSPFLYGHVDAACNMIGARKPPPCSPLLLMPATQNIMLLNGEVIFAASLPNSSNCCSNQKTEYRLPVTSLSSCDSLPESAMSVSKTATMSAPPTPATMEKFYKTMQDKKLSSELIDLVEEGVRKETLMEKELCSSLLAFDKLVSDKVIIVLSEEASEKSMGVQKSSNKRKNSGIDLNVATPKKRPHKKKHRPKVFEEGKPSRTPKPATPQLETDGNTGLKGSTSCKRKYVRRKKDVTHPPETASNALGEVVDAEGKGEAKSVRRCLNFDLEEQCAVDEFSDAMSMFKKVLGAPDLEECDGSAVTSSSVKETADCIRIPNDVAVKPSAVIISDLNSSTHQSKTECSNLLQISALPGEVNKNMCASVKPMPFLKSSVKHFKALARETACLDSAAVNFPISLEVAQKNLNTNKIYDDPRFMVQEKVQEGMLTYNQTEGYVQKNPFSGWGEISLCSSGSTSRMPNPVKTFKQKTKGIIQPSTPKNLSKFRDTLENEICRNQGHLETSEEIMKSLNTNIKTSTKKQDKDLQLNLMISSTKQTFLEEWEPECRNGIFPAQNIVEGGALSTRSLNWKNFPEIFPVDYESTCYYNFLASSSSGTLVPFKNPIDDIVRKLRRLSLRSSDEVSSSQAQNSIVPYVDHGGVMVASERNFHLIKKQRPRPKVDLDPESNRVCKLLMGKECSEGDERSDVDKEKWWDEERRIFQGRVDSFIARMHLVQGDRRFTQWKGSVVDSVVGVFLTQNVSDHLSSSAFMALAANFPLSRGKGSVPNGEKVSTSAEIPDRCIISFIDTPKMQRNLLDRASFKCSLEVNVAECGDKKETINSSETHGSISTRITYYSRQKGKGRSLYLQKKEATSCQESTMSGSGANLAEREDIRFLEDAITSQNSASSSQNSMNFRAPSNEHIGSNSFLNIEADGLSGSRNTDALGSSSFTKLLQIAQSRSFKEVYSRGRGMISATKIQESSLSIENNPSLWSQLDSSKGDIQSCDTDSSLHHAVPPPTESCQFDGPFNSEVMANNAIHFRDSRYHLLSTRYELFGGNDFEVMNNKGSESVVSLAESTSLPKISSSSKTATNIDSCMPINKLTTQVEVDANLYSASHKNMTKDIIDVTKNENPNVCSSLQDENVTTFYQNGNSTFQAEITHSAVQARHQLEKCRTQQTAVSDKQTERNLDVTDKGGPNLKAETRSFPIVSPETPVSATKSRKRRSEVENNTYDWESLRKEVCCTKPAQERSSSTMDSLDWEAVRMADVSKISEAIRGRGMNNVLAERIKEFLNRLVREHGSIDLEWLRDAPPDKVKDYLLSIRGLGLKSAECVRLLTLQQLAFPVDTNVGRICVRLGWVPLQPLPESLQLHLLELYPMLATIQKYLWPRLCKLNQRTLYELHYQMITFGKVFCTKRKPNCNSCPMRGECKHFASAFASARLALPAPEDNSVVSFTAPIASEKSHTLFKNLTPLPQLKGDSNSGSNSQECTLQNNCEPIVEEPASPEPECPKVLESAIEDAFYEDPDEIPTIKLNFEEFTQNLRNYMEENMELQDGSLSKALVALTPAAASIPMPKLKNVSRLRTDHQVYEIPDSHPLLEGVETREPDDPSPYLLAIWTPGETAHSTEPPKACCNSLDRDQLCERSTCFTCNSIREAESHKVRGTLLIPCRTAMRGSFPLNGTYFQVNEVFADHHSSCDPIYVPRDWIWNLPRRTVYFGTSIPTIFRGLTTEEIQQCFWRGFVCVRGFDRVSRAPKPIYARLHFPASKAPKNRKAAEPNLEK